MKNLRLEGVTKVYDPGKSYQVDALRGIDAEFESGRSYAIMGRRMRFPWWRWWATPTPANPHC